LRYRSRACRFWCWWLASWVIAIGSVSRASAQSTAPARDVALAESYAEQAFEAYARRQYATALELYEKAYDAAPSADAIYNIARVYDLGLRDRPLAITHYRRYLSDPGALPERIGRASQRLSELLEAEAAVVKAAPAAPRVSPPMAVLPPSRAIMHDTGSGWSALEVAAVVTGAVGVVGIGVGAALGLSVLADADTVDSYCAGNLCSSQRGVDVAESALKKASMATLGVAVGAGLLATGATLWLLAPSGAPPQAGSGGLALTPVAGRSRLGMELSGAWW
jgi:tetratricopeptide (TPR) repeat protein